MSWLKLPGTIGIESIQASARVNNPKVGDVQQS